MKKLLVFMLCTLLTMLVTSCDYFSKSKESGTYSPEDSLFVSTEIQKYITPAFSSAEEIHVYQEQIKQIEEEKVVFLSMTPQMIQRVTKVVLYKSKDGYITIHELIEEYTRNYDVYRALTENDERLPIDPHIMDQDMAPLPLGDDTIESKL